VKKIPTIFVRDLSKQPSLVTTEWVAGCEWVRDGEGVPTAKIDGTCCLIRDGKLYKRRELKKDQPMPADFEQADFDRETGKTVGWVPVGEGPDDKYHRSAFTGTAPDGTYELVGPKVQGGKAGFAGNFLVRHGADKLPHDTPRTFDGLKTFFEQDNPLSKLEGIVWHHSDGRMAKIKRRDFGLRW
jgi:hypothetical protein